MAQKEFLAGNEILGRASRAAGATAFYGYPITPSSEIAHYWAAQACSEQGKKDGLVFLQGEDEISAGFQLIGGVLAGVKSLTASAGPGHVLHQDALSMAEAMRLPVVYYIMQRGGPSTSTVLYSQQEVNLACFGGNGNGFRIVYSASNHQELYDYGIKVFNVAWKWRFPTLLLGDGMTAKTLAEVELYEPAEKGIELVETEPYLTERDRKIPMAGLMPSPEYAPRTGDDGTVYDCYRNCLNMEEETLTVNKEIEAAFNEMAQEVTEYEEYGPADAKILIVAHGIVSSGVKQAVDALGGQARLFRPITLRPFAHEALRAAAAKADKVIVAESAINQLGRFVKESLVGQPVNLIEHYRPGTAILAEEIVELVNANQA
jgi:2-oxoglutarate ferredoxin oxidoreductase subunit alpha